MVLAFSQAYPWTDMIIFTLVGYVIIGVDVVALTATEPSFRGIVIFSVTVITASASRPTIVLLEILARNPTAHAIAGFLLLAMQVFLSFIIFSI